MTNSRVNRQESQHEAGKLQPSADDSRPEPIEISGSVKWFSVEKGYGFIVADDGGRDILLHASVLQRSGFAAPPNGARVVAMVRQAERGPQACGILSMQGSTASDSDGIPAPRADAPTTSNGEPERALVKWFNRVDGFGFLTRGQGTKDIFVHTDTLQRCGLTELRQGQVVFVRFQPGAKGLTATEIQLNTSD